MDGYKLFVILAFGIGVSVILFEIFDKVRIFRREKKIIKAENYEGVLSGLDQKSLDAAMRRIEMQPPCVEEEKK